MTNTPRSNPEIDDSTAALQLETRAQGVVLPVKAQPGARKNELRGVQDGALKVCVTQAPEKGKANKAIIETLAKTLKLKKSQIQLVSGELASQKKFLVEQIDEATLRQKIAQATSESS